MISINAIMNDGAFNLINIHLILKIGLNLEVYYHMPINIKILKEIFSFERKKKTGSAFQLCY